MNVIQLKKALDELDWTLKDVAFVTRRATTEVELYVARSSIPQDVVEAVIQELKRRGLPYRAYLNPSGKA